MNIQVGLLIIGSLSIVLALLLYLVMRRSSLEQRLTERVRAIEDHVAAYQERVQLIVPHASDYINSLGLDGNRLLDEIRVRISSIEALTQEVGSLLAAKDLGALQEAELLLDGNHPVQQRPRRNFDGTTTQYCTLPPGWDEELEEMLQQLGSRLSQASLRAAEAGIPKRPKRQSTIFSLFKAGIKTTGKPYDW